jgi:hypothetical protein
VEGAGERDLVQPPTISLPKGGGAIRGIGEKFAANPVTGTGSMTVPIATSSGRSGFGPQLALSYDSGAGNGLFGFGWNLSLPSITRKTDKGLPQYRDGEDSDVLRHEFPSEWHSLLFPRSDPEINETAIEINERHFHYFLHKVVQQRQFDVTVEVIVQPKQDFRGRAPDESPFRGLRIDLGPGDEPPEGALQIDGSRWGALPHAVFPPPRIPTAPERRFAGPHH